MAAAPDEWIGGDSYWAGIGWRFQVAILGLAMFNGSSIIWSLL